MPARTGRANQGQSTVEGNAYRVFVSDERKEGIVGDDHWVTWVMDAGTRSFSYKSSDILITLRCESRAKGQFWYAYKKASNKLHKVYVGKSEDLTVESLNDAVIAMQGKMSGKPQEQATHHTNDKLPNTPASVAPAIFLADYTPEPTRKQVPFGLDLGEKQREVLCVIAAGLRYEPNYRDGISARRIARGLAEKGLLVEVTQHPNHRYHAWRLTEAGLTLIRKDKDLQQQVKRWLAALD